MNTGEAATRRAHTETEMESPIGVESVGDNAGEPVRTASLAHELRQPLFALKARLQLAHGRAEGLAPSDVDVLLDHIAHLEAVLHDYTSPDPRPADVFDLREPVERAIALLGERARVVGAEVRVALPPGPVRVHGRATAMRQVAVNLLRNALDAVEMVDDRLVEVAVTVEPDHARLMVRDRGPGIASDVREALFEPFVTTKGQARGSGLGLFIVRQLVDKMAGRLSLQPHAEGGTEVRVELTLA